MPGFPVILEQFEGPPPHRTVRLERSALPEEQFVEKLGVKIDKVIYPGSKIATLQILAIEHKPIRLQGLLSDREERIAGFADAAREALKGLLRDARRIRLIYRTIVLVGVITELSLGERDEHEIRYEIEIEVQKDTVYPPPGGRKDRDAFTVINAVAEAIAGATDAIVELPEEMREPPPEWAPDPWLEFRLGVEDVHKRTRFLLELVGNENALNLDDRATTAMRAGWTAANTARSALDEWDGSALGLVDQLTQGSNVLTAMDSIDKISLALG